MRLAIIICVVIFNVAISESKIWADDDTVVIEGPTEEELLQATNLQQVSFPGFNPAQPWPYPRPGVVGSCLTANGQQGKCTTLKQCYPIIYYMYAIEEGEENKLKDGLTEFLIQSAGPCSSNKPIAKRSYRSTKSGKDVPGIRQFFVCCTSQNKKPPSILPFPKPTQRPTTNPPIVNPPTPFPPIGNPPTITSKPPTSTDQPKVISTDCGRLTKTPGPYNATVEDVDQQLRVVGGAVSQRGAHPWIVALTNNGRQFCGGSLIDNYYVLTAAHCVSHMTSGDIARLKVHLGEVTPTAHSIRTPEGGEQILTVSRVLYNKGFSHQTLHNDVALLKLNKAAEYSQYAAKVCLANDPKTTYDNQIVKLAGWGQIYDGGPQSDVLREVAMDIWTNARCRTKYGSMAPAGIIPSMICAASSGKDACRGDSGGPLVYQNPSTSTHTLVGVVSWGIGCGSYPGVYSRVSSFVPWITKNTST